MLGGKGVMAENGIVTVELCMGSSCFARGNSQVLTEIEAFLSDNNLEDKVELVGHLCLNKCNDGPNITIDGVPYSGLNAERVIETIQNALEANK